MKHWLQEGRVEEATVRVLERGCCGSLRLGGWSIWVKDQWEPASGREEGVLCSYDKAVDESRLLGHHSWKKSHEPQQ